MEKSGKALFLSVFFLSFSPSAMEKFAWERHKMNDLELALLRALNKAMEPMLKEQNLDKAFSRILETAMALVPHAQTGSLLVKENGTLYFKAAVGFNLDKLREVAIPLSSSLGIIGKGCEILKIKNLDQFDKEYLSAKDYRILKEFGRLTEIKISLVAPLMLPGGSKPPWDEEETLGHLTVNNMEDEDAFNDIAVEILSILAKQASVALWKAQMYSQLELREKLYKDLLDQAQEGIWRVNEEGRTIYINPKMEEILGYSAEELYGKPASLFLYSHDPEKRNWYSKRRRNGIKETFEDCLRHKNGNPIWVEMKVSPLYSDKGEIAGSQILLVDISEKKALERAKDDLLYAFSHEMKTPIQALLSLTENLKIAQEKEKVQPDVLKADEIIPIFERNLMRLNAMVNNFLDAQRGWVGEKDEDLKLCNLKEIVLKTVQLESPLAENKGLLLEMQFEDGCPMIYGDEEELLQVFVNLVSNAIRFSSNGKIELKGSCNGDFLVVTISDQGIGIPAEEFPLLFTPFYRPKDDVRRVYAGTGLGLYVTKKILERHRGDISIQSEPGQGTTVTVKLPFH